MAGDTDNPRIWINADVYVAPVGTPAPTDTTSELDADFDALGLLSEDDDLVMARSEDVTDHYAWGSILVRTTRSKHKRTIKVVCIEDNAIVFGLANPGSEVETAGGVTTREVRVPNAPDRRAFILELADGDITKRLSIPTGEVSAVADVTLRDSILAKTELTISVYPDASGVLFHEITDDPGAAPSGS